MQKRYEAAERLLTKNIRDKVLNGKPMIRWGNDHTFTYMRQMRGEHGIENVKVQVDAKTGEETIITNATQTDETIRIEQETGRRVGGEQTGHETTSPDGKYVLFTREHNLVLRESCSGEETVLTYDGEQWLEYGCYIDVYSQITVQREGYVDHPLVLWSPDGRYFVTYRADRRKCKKLYVMESYSDSVPQIRPQLKEYPCPFVTDSDEEIPHYQLYVGDTKDKTFKKVDAPEFLYPVYTTAERSWVRWLDDSSGFYFTWIARGYQEGRLYLADAATGHAKEMVKETTDMFLNLGAANILDGYGNYIFSNFVTGDRKLAFWQSERNGYAHLYRFELPVCNEAEMNAGTLTDETVTGVDLFGEEYKTLIVQKIVKVDEANRKIYFMGNNEADCSDPLFYQLYSVDFDGTEVRRLTPEDATHTISMGKESFVDTYSRIDLPPVTVLRKNDGSLIRELEHADIEDLLKQGYQIPQRFTVKAADGVTDLYGILVPPAMLSENEAAYPVIDYIYGAAQLYNVPRDFTWDNPMNREIMGGLQEFAQLGFAGIILDGRGTPGRGKEFHRHSNRRFEWCNGILDHVHCAKELKEKFPFLDMERVGMWGNSGGGYGTVTAMLTYPDFYKVGVASAGNYDQRMYEHSWTERYGGLHTCDDTDCYERSDVTKLAGNLKGKLLLAYGAMDDNVPMSQTIRLCDALTKNNKDYDLMVLPRVNHNVPADMYFIRRKMDYFVEHLLGEKPPKEYRFACMEEHGDTAN
ncbi:MAG: prolyl oligopeptidase family serine peptidase [Lachnospiraceae bacterium]|nr:prolyl oligopeptidase family serine peptidase [Lachnospiraceae bacterium]